MSDSEKHTRYAKNHLKPKLAAHASQTASKCSLCNGDHYITRGFASKSVIERRELVNAKRLCYNCLGSHQLSECRTQKRCRVCNGHHHTMIHLASADRNSSLPTSSSVSVAIPGSSTSVSASVNTVLALQATSTSPTLLATAILNIVSSNEKLTSVRVLLDQDSELSFVCESLVQFLRVRRHAHISIIGIGSKSAGSTCGSVSLQIQSRIDPAVRVDVAAYILPRLTGLLPATRLRTSSWPHTQGLLADPNFATPGRIDIILGADIIGSLLKPSIRQGDRNKLTAQDTSLGWILFGATEDAHASPSSAVSSTCTGGFDHELISSLH